MGHPKATDPWTKKEPVDGVAPACGEMRREALGGPGAYFTWTDNKGSDTAVNVYNEDEIAWEAAPMAGKPPPPSELFAMSSLEDGRMFLTGGHDLREHIPRDKSYFLTKEGQDEAATWKWDAAVAELEA